MIPGNPFPPIYPPMPSFGATGFGSGSLSGTVLEPPLPPAAGLHYPSQDPSRLGAVKK